MKYNGKKYSGQNINKIMYQEILEQIEVNIKYKIKGLRFGIIKNMHYYPTLEVTNIIDYAINGLVRKIYY
jgi:hypothetical protein